MHLWRFGRGRLTVTIFCGWRHQRLWQQESWYLESSCHRRLKLIQQPLVNCPSYRDREARLRGDRTKKVEL
ncbi:hypothetical protein [Scytonema sp. HK-05]|uniref:hypothetical protein n=1 Tax=Scytonema sp. HK-05 TaxID=1137095 RepID=UPI001160F65D